MLKFSKIFVSHYYKTLDKAKYKKNAHEPRCSRTAGTKC